MTSILCKILPLLPGRYPAPKLEEYVISERHLTRSAAMPAIRMNMHTHADPSPCYWNSLVGGPSSSWIEMQPCPHKLHGSQVWVGLPLSFINDMIERVERIWSSEVSRPPHDKENRVWWPIHEFGSNKPNINHVTPRNEKIIVQVRVFVQKASIHPPPSSRRDSIMFQIRYKKLYSSSLASRVFQQIMG